MRLYIKNMVCNRCIYAVDDLFKDLKYKNYRVELGQVDLLEESISEAKTDLISTRLEPLGFELINDRNSKIIDFIKTLIIKKIHHTDLEEFDESWSTFISKTLFHDYKYLSQLFSSVEGITIEHFIILQKIEKVKEMIVYNELTLSEIAYQMKYSSVSHLSNQFKKVTGMTPTAFKQLGHSGRQSIDKL